MNDKLEIKESILSSTKDSNYIGIYFQGKEIIDTFWKIKCPCGVEVSYPVNGLPTVNTIHPCGNPNHWTVKYD